MMHECRAYGAQIMIEISQPYRAGLKFGNGPPGLDDGERSAALTNRPAASLPEQHTLKADALLSRLLGDPLM